MNPDSKESLFVSNATVTIERADSLRLLSGKTDDRGDARLGSLVPGLYIITVEHSGYQTAHQNFSITGSELVNKTAFVSLTPLLTGSPSP